MTSSTHEPDEPNGERALEPSIHEDTEAAHQRRVEALRQLAQTSGATPQQDQPQAQAAEPKLTRETLPGPGGAPRAARARPWWAPLSAALAVIVIAAGVGSYLLIHPHASTTRPLPNAVTITIGNDCPSKLLWSPNGRTLAVLEYSGSEYPCSGNIAQDVIIALYNATTGAFQQHIALSTLLSGTASTGTLDGIGWSPDSGQLVLEINTTANLITGPVVSYVLLLIPAQGGQAQTIQ
ncbi:MAG TPA: hypothetical protein VKQ36_07225, partial [Ktedonobacterales bacterium]|nr:hypothetical protein [Ktedonobacterales bacterium]